MRSDPGRLTVFTVGCPCRRGRLRVSELNRDAVLRARETIGGRLHRTPTFSSATVSERVGANVHLKAELFQRTGSFKPRGMLAKLASLSDDEKRSGVVTWSAGNAAQGLAWAAAAEDSCRVFMWRTANPLKVAATRGYGAEVDLESEDAASSYERLQEHVERTSAVFVSPFDDPVLQSGTGRSGSRSRRTSRRATTVVVPVGGGGLIAGIASAPERQQARHRRRAGGRAVADGRARGRAHGADQAADDRRRARRAVHGRGTSPS